MVIVITGTNFFKIILHDLKMLYKPVESVRKWWQDGMINYREWIKLNVL